MSGHGTMVCSSASPHIRSQPIVSARKLAFLLWPLRAANVRQNEQPVCPIGNFTRNPYNRENCLQQYLSAVWLCHE